MQYEMGVKYRLGERTRLNAAVYEIHTDDEIVVASATDGRTSYRNAGRTVRRGFEASLQSDLSEQWQTTLVYTRTDARYADDISQTIESGNRLPGVPLNNLFGELVWKPVSSISMGLKGSTAARCMWTTATTPRPHLRMRYSTGGPGSSNMWGPGRSTSCCGWTTCLTGSMWGR